MVDTKKKDGRVVATCKRTEKMTNFSNSYGDRSNPGMLPRVLPRTSVRTWVGNRRLLAPERRRNLPVQALGVVSLVSEEVTSRVLVSATVGVVRVRGEIFCGTSGGRRGPVRLQRPNGRGRTEDPGVEGATSSRTRQRKTEGTRRRETVNRTSTGIVSKGEQTKETTRNQTTPKDLEPTFKDSSEDLGVS